MKVITKAEDLTTKPDKTAAGFIWQAKEKTVRAAEIIGEAISIKKRLDACHSVAEIIKDRKLKGAVLFCAGLSVKAQGHLSDSQLRIIAKKTLEEISASGSDLGTEVLYRYLLTAGESLGGTMRNLVGAFAQKLFASLVEEKLQKARVKYARMESGSGKVQVIHWRDRVLVFDKTPKFLKKNVDVILLSGNAADFQENDLLNSRENYLAVGELKGGIDPAGADEHWKTAKSALQRVREVFEDGTSPKLFFIGTAIEDHMAREIFRELSTGKLEAAANLTSEEQTSTLIDWLISL